MITPLPHTRECDARQAHVEQLRRELFGDDVTVDDAAYVLSVERCTILRYLRHGVLKGAYKMGRTWHIPQSSLVEFRDRQLAANREARDAAERRGGGSGRAAD